MTATSPATPPIEHPRQHPAGPLRPPIPYFGGKQTIAQRIIAEMPAHKHYVEPYCGSLAVLLAKEPVAHETVNDLDGDLVNFWRVLRDQPDALARVCALTPHSRGEFEATREPTDDPLENARRIWVQLAQGRAAIRQRTGWRFFETGSSSSMGMPGYLAGYVKRIPPAAERLARVTLECRPALDIITRYGEHEDVLLYVDPPYLGSTRTSGKYLVEMQGDDEHQDLLNALLARRASVVLSGYPSTLYDAALTNWRRVAIPTSTGQGGTWSDRTEILWINRPANPRQISIFDLLDDEANA